MPSLRWLKRHGALEHPSHIKLIVGLGNPGARFAQNRHNVGFFVVDQFAQAHALDFSRRRFSALLAEGRLAGQRVMVAKPQTFMNASGDAVGKLFAFYKIAPHDLLVIYDDLDLPLGKIRLRSRGSAGGHHGMESIIARIGTSDFPRLRIGIGRPDPESDVEHVLSDFTEDERAVAEETIVRAVAAIEAWLRHGIVFTMNEFN